MNLQGCRILVTRPAGQADFLMQSLHACGAEPVHFPLLAIEALDEQRDAEKICHARALVQQLDNFHKIIFISTNAVAFGLPLIDAFWPQWPVGVEWYAIGSATRRALEQHDIVVTASDEQAMTSESLLSLPAFADLASQRVLIVQGEGGRELLSPLMQQRGARVDNLICYRRSVPPQLAGQWQAIAAQPLQAVLISSGEGLQNWLGLPGVEQYRPCLLIAPSERVATQARAAGFLRVIAAENASDTAMLAALQAAAQ